MITKWLSTLAVALACFWTSIAVACPPPPPPPPQDVGESDTSYAARVAAFQAQQEANHQAWLHAQQVRLWDEADAVFIARIERVRPGADTYYGPSQRATLRPQRMLKGRRYTNRFTLTHTDATSCGPIPGFPAIMGNVGDTYVVFVRGGRPAQATVQHTIAPADITDERIRAALAAE